MVLGHVHWILSPPRLISLYGKRIACYFARCKEVLSVEFIRRVEDAKMPFADISKITRNIYIKLVCFFIVSFILGVKTNVLVSCQTYKINKQIENISHLRPRRWWVWGCGCGCRGFGVSASILFHEETLILRSSSSALWRLYLKDHMIAWEESKKLSMRLVKCFTKEKKGDWRREASIVRRLSQNGGHSNVLKYCWHEEGGWIHCCFLHLYSSMMFLI